MCNIFQINNYMATDLIKKIIEDERMLAWINGFSKKISSRQADFLLCLQWNGYNISDLKLNKEQIDFILEEILKKYHEKENTKSPLVKKVLSDKSFLDCMEKVNNLIGVKKDFSLRSLLNDFLLNDKKYSPDEIKSCMESFNIHVDSLSQQLFYSLVHSGYKTNNIFPEDFQIILNYFKNK